MSDARAAGPRPVALLEAAAKAAAAGPAVDSLHCTDDWESLYAPERTHWRDAMGAALAVIGERLAKVARDYAFAYMSEDTFGDGRRCGEQIAAEIERLTGVDRGPRGPRVGDVNARGEVYNRRGDWVTVDERGRCRDCGATPDQCFDDHA